ncbi:hypothetical protein T492DRAFT_975733 [Pavlovales sp. CCMP2436]|nr:hypothetical protein T492DRAFT_975733 [Pavlovales sp. CCMP2436]
MTEIFWRKTSTQWSLQYLSLLYDLEAMSLASWSSAQMCSHRCTELAHNPCRKPCRASSNVSTPCLLCVSHCARGKYTSELMTMSLANLGGSLLKNMAMVCRRDLRHGPVFV